MQNGADDFEPATHAGIADQLPIPTCVVIIVFVLDRDADGAERTERGLAVDTHDFHFNAELAIHF